MKIAKGNEEQHSVYKTAFTHTQDKTIAVQDLDIATTPENLKIMEPTTLPFEVVGAAFRGTGKADTTDATNESVHVSSASSAAPAMPLQIMKFGQQESDGGDPLKVVCHEDALKSILDKTGDRSIVVLAIAGPMRQGKSFYLNFILRRLHSIHGTTNEAEPLHGFKWRGNNDPVTDGIWMWSEPFTLKSQVDGSPFDLLLMDTQGVFDEDTGEREWSILMGLSLLTSSTFIYNTVNNINDKDLQLLSEFLSFGEMVLQDPNNGGKRKPFQNLVFLVRDWNSPSQFSYGSEGGKKFIQTKLMKKASHQKDNSLVRDKLENCFQDISSILLPHPGQEALKEDYSGSLASCGLFAKEFNDSVDYILFQGNKLPSKTINGNTLKGQDIFELFTSYTKLFNEADMLTPESIYYAQAKACNATVVNTCIAGFISRIKAKLEKAPIMLDGGDLDQIWKDERQRALTQFEKSKKMGSRRLIDEGDNELCNQLKSEFARLKSNYSTYRQQSISKAQNSAVQQYVAIMESIVIGDAFHSNDLLQETSKSAQVEAIAQFCSFLQLKNADDLASEKEAISKLIKSKFEDFCIRNDAKMDEAENHMRQEVETFRQFYLERMQAKINGEMLPQDKLGKYHAKIALPITQEFTRKHEQSPLLNTTLQLLSDKIETEYENLKGAILAQKEEAVENAKELASKAVVQYRTRIMAENPKEYNQFQKLHSATKKAVFSDLKNVQTAEVMTEILLAEIQSSFESQIGQAHAELSVTFHKKLAQSQKEMEVAKKIAKAQYKERMKRLFSDQHSVLTDPELEEEHRARWKKAMQLMSQALEENCLPLNDTEKESAKKDLSDSLKQVFTKILHQNAQKRKKAEQGIGAYIDILSKEYAEELKYCLANIDKNGTTEVNIEELHTKINSKIEAKFYQLHHNSPLYAKGKQNLIDKLSQERDTILKERDLRKKSIHEKFTNAVDGALQSYITAMEELNKKGSGTDEEYQNAHEENKTLSIKMFRKSQENHPSSSSQITEKYGNNLIVLINESFANSFAEFKQNKINLVEAIREAKESAKAMYTQAMEIYFQESSEPFSELQFLTQHNQEKKDARLHCLNLCQALQKTEFQNDIQDIEAVLIELGKEINSISDTFGKRNNERKLQIRQDLENMVIPHVEQVFNKSVLTALTSDRDLVSVEQINKCQSTVINSLTKEIVSPFKSSSYAYKLRLELLEKIVAEKMKELQQAHNNVKEANNKNNESVDEAFSLYKNKMIDVLVSGCERDNFESAHLSVLEEALDILRKSAATAPNLFLDKLKNQIHDFRKDMEEKSSEFASRMSEAVEAASRIYTQGLSTYIQSRRYVDEAEITSKHHSSRDEAIRSLTNDLQELTLYSKTVRGVESGCLAELEKRLSQISTEIQDTNLANKEATEERMEASVKTITEDYIVDISLELQTGTSPTIEQVEVCHNQIFNKSMDKFSRGNSKSPLFPKWNDVLKEKLENELLALQHQITAAQEQTNREGEALVHDGMTYYCESMNELIKEDEDNFEKSHRLVKKLSIDLLKKISTPEQVQIFANQLEAQIQIAYEGFSSKISADRTKIQNEITKFKEQSLRNYEDKIKTFLNEKTVQISDQKLEEEHNREMKIAQNKFNGLYDDIETSSRFFKDQQKSDVKDLTEKIQTLFERMKELSNQKMAESKKQLDATIANLKKQYVQAMTAGCNGEIVLGKEFEKLHISVTTSCFDELRRTWSDLYLFKEGQERLTTEIEAEKNKLASEMKAALDKIHGDLQIAVTSAVQKYSEEMSKIKSEDELVLADAHKHQEQQAMNSLKKLKGAQNAIYFDNYSTNLQSEIHTAHVKLIEIRHRSKNELQSSLLQTLENAKKFYETEMDAFFNFIPDYIDPQALEEQHKLKATAATKILKEKYEGVKRLCSHDQAKETSDFEDLRSSIQISYNKFKMVNKDRLHQLHDELKELQRSIKQKYTQQLKTLAEEAANEDEFTHKNVDAITAFGRELRTKLEAKNAEKEFITDLLNDMKLFMQEQGSDFFKIFESRMAQNKTNVRTALIEARKYYNEEMRKRVKTKPWFKPEDLARINTEVINLSISKCESVTLTPEQENQLRDAMVVVYQKYSEDNTLKMPVKNPAIGIDLGTTYSCVGVYVNGEVKIIPNRDVSDATTIPSYVTFNKNHTIDVGETAKNQAFLYPQNTIFDAKRLIGRSFSDPIVQKDIKLWPFSVINDNDKPKIKVFDKQFRPEDISAKILIKLKNIAESYLHETVKEAVVTVPAYFNDGQRQATRDAAEIAGLKVKILNEPTAAAIAYKLHRTDELKRNVLIFDLGGGTFDVAVLEIKGKDIVVKATGGDTHLGGEDFDNNIVNHMIQLVNTKFNRDLARGRDSSVSEEKSKASGRLRRLRDRCEAAKRNLSDSLATVIAMDSIDGEFDLREELTRKEFEDLNMDLFTKCINLVEQSLKDAKVEKTDIDDIVLVGGSTRIPKVQELLKQFFDNKKELNGTINADEAVARGAAIQAALLHGEQATSLRDSVKLTDVTPLSLGTDVLGGHMSVIIPKHSKVPCSHTKTFITTVNRQTTVNCHIYEGEKRMAIENNNLGNFVLKNIPPAPAGQEKVECTMTIDDEGILHVRAVCVSNNVEKEITIETYNGRMTPEEIIKAQTAEPFAW